MDIKRPGNFLKDPNTNWRYMLIVVILAFFAGGGIFSYWRWLSKQKVEVPKIEMLEKKATERPKTPVDWEFYGTVKPSSNRENWSVYRNEKLNFQISFPDNFELKVKKDCLMHDDNYWGVCVLALEKPSRTSWTVFGEGIEIHIGESELALEYCLKGYKMGYRMADIEINGVVFQKQEALLQSVMGGKGTKGYLYSTIHNGKCYYLISKFHFDTSSIQDLDEEEKKEAQRKLNEKIYTALKEFEEIVKTFVFTDPE